MPTSPYAHVYNVIEFLVGIRPESVLDVGVGNGKMGFLARDLLDVMLGERYRKDRWKVQIDGIEVFSDYIQDHQRAIYDRIYIGDAFQVIDELGSYDAVILGDVLEHFEKPRGAEFLDKCISHANGYVILCIPLGDGWQQEDIYGNPFERHLSFWNHEEFAPYARSFKILHYKPGPYGVYLMEKDAYIDAKIGELGKNACGKPSIALSIREKLHLDTENISRIDLTPLSRHVADEVHRGYFLDTGYKEHYPLIAHLSTLFNGVLIFDIGTNSGCSALALSYNPSNRIVSYDVTDCRKVLHPEKLGNIEFCIGDVLRDDRLLKSPLLMLDTNHDGVFEGQFYRFLKENHYRGLLFLDDIHLNEPMKNFWHSITERKEDITDLGHWSGSGIVEL